MTVAGWIVVNTWGGPPLYASFHPEERVAKALACDELARLGHGKQTWQQWESRGYACRQAALEWTR